MLWYDTFDVSEGIAVNKTSESPKFIICNYYYFFSLNPEFKPNLYYGCDGLM